MDDIRSLQLFPQLQKPLHEHKKIVAGNLMSPLEHVRPVLKRHTMVFKLYTFIGQNKKKCTIKMFYQLSQKCCQCSVLNELIRK